MTEADAALSRARQIDQVCDQFESQWKAGGRPSVDAYLAAVPPNEQDALRSALLAVERELREGSLVDTSVTHSRVSSNPPRRGGTASKEKAADVLPASIGRFSIRGVLGEGAFGKVYRAADPHLGREVALKVPLPSTIAAAAERTRFVKEAQAAATINHPNICQIHEVGEHDGQPYIVMAMVPGQSLAETLKSRKAPLPERQTALLVRKIALALAAAHDKGIVHRDLKPANVMFDRERKDIVLMDFGLARGPQMGDARLTQSGVVMGTPAYMSPEQARGDSKDIGPSGDIFSLGVILYELLTGSRPFAGTATEVLGQILHVDPQPPTQRRAEIDPRLEAICLKAMAKNPADRFGSMREFAAAIDAMLRTPAAAESTGTASAQSIAANKPGTDTMAEVFAALSADRKQTQAETAAAVDAAMARHRTPRWLIALSALLVVGSIGVLAGIVFFTRSEKVKVTIELTDVDLADTTLTFFLDKQPIEAEALANPIELKPGKHELVVKRGEQIVKRILLTVSGGAQPGLEMKEIPVAQSDLDRWQGRWQCVTENSWGRVIYENDSSGRGPIQVIKGNTRDLDRVSATHHAAVTSEFRIDDTVSPKTFDCDAFGTPNEKRFQQSGVYEFVGDRLRVVYRFAHDKHPDRATWDDIGKSDVHYYEFERRAADEVVWTPMIQSADELIEGETISKNEASRWVKFHDGILEMRGEGASFRPKFSAKNYIVRSQVLFLDRTILCYVRVQPGVFGGYGVFFNQYSADWDVPSCGIGKQAMGKPWQDVIGTQRRLSEELPQELAVAAFGSEITVYVNGKRMVSATDRDSAEGAIRFLITKDNRHAILRDLQVCNLDGTNLTPDDIFPQHEDPEAVKLLSPQYLTEENRKQNLLSNAGFESGDAAWKFESWRRDSKVGQVVDVPTHSGSKALQLRYAINDAASYRQSVTVKPHKRYLLSGWIRTKDLKYAERDHKGADLFVPGAYYFSSPNLRTTDDWTYYAIVVPSGNRTKMEVGLRLGLNAGTVTGTAWFDDLCLIELPD